MILTKENQSTLGEILPSVTLSSINTARTSLGKNAGVRRERPSTNSLNDLPYKLEFNLIKLTCDVAVETLLL
jgi:hypothetical protein